MWVNFATRLRDAFKLRIRIVIAGWAVTVRPLSWQVALAAAVLLLGLGLWLGRPAREARAFASKAPPILDVHQSMMRDALGGIFASERLQIIIKAVAEADTGDFLKDEKVHFDNSSFTLGSRWIESQYVVAVEKAGSCDTQEEALRQWGLLLHTVQDFYSHSNFIEKIGKGGTAPPIGRDFLRLRNITDVPRSLTAIGPGGFVGSQSSGQGRRPPACCVRPGGGAA